MWPICESKIPPEFLKLHPVLDWQHQFFVERNIWCHILRNALFHPITRMSQPHCTSHILFTTWGAGDKVDHITRFASQLVSHFVSHSCVRARKMCRFIDPGASYTGATHPSMLELIATRYFRGDPSFHVGTTTTTTRDCIGGMWLASPCHTTQYNSRQV